MNIFDGRRTYYVAVYPDITTTVSTKLADININRLEYHITTLKYNKKIEKSELFSIQTLEEEIKNNIINEGLYELFKNKLLIREMYYIEENELHIVLKAYTRRLKK